MTSENVSKVCERHERTHCVVHCRDCGKDKYVTRKGASDHPGLCGECFHKPQPPVVGCCGSTKTTKRRWYLKFIGQEDWND